MSQGGYSKVIHQPSGSSTTTRDTHFAQQPRASSRRRRPCVCGAFSFCGRRGHPQTPLGGHPSPCTASPSPPRGHVHETMTGRGGATTGVLVLAAGRWGWATRGASIVRSHKTTHPSFFGRRFRAVLRWHSGRKKGPNARTKRALYRHAVARWGLRRGLRPAVRKPRPLSCRRRSHCRRARPRTSPKSSFASPTASRRRAGSTAALACVEPLRALERPRRAPRELGRARRFGRAAVYRRGVAERAASRRLETGTSLPKCERALPNVEPRKLKNAFNF